jgi:cell wall-associated NlpC family hydrolase
VALPANEPIKAHDAIVYYGKKMMPQHFAIYIGNGYICHHIIHRLSAREPISSFNKKIAFILRHKSQM